LIVICVQVAIAVTPSPIDAEGFVRVARNCSCSIDRKISFSCSARALPNDLILLGASKTSRYVQNTATNTFNTRWLVVDGKQRRKTVAIHDETRPESRPTVEQCRSAGIQVQAPLCPRHSPSIRYDRWIYD
jgi:hypothetical protein